MLLFLLIFIIELLLLSRGGMLLGILILSTLIVLNFFNRSISWSKLIGLIVLCVCSFYLVKELQTNQQSYLFIIDPFYGVKSESGDERLALWKISYQLFLEKPIFGYGSGSWLYEYMRNGVGDLAKVNYTPNYVIHPHNLFVEKLFENGLPGFMLCIIVFMLFPFWYFLSKWKTKTFSKEDYLWLFGIMC